jgi:signal transduction histidine kinase
MNRSLQALWLAILAAVVTIALLAQSWITQRSRSARQRVSEVLASQLVPIDEAIGRLIDSYLLEIKRSTATDISQPIQCVELRRNPLIRTLGVVDRQQQVLIYPENLRNSSSDERTLVDEAQQMLRDRFPSMPQPTQQASQSPPSQIAPVQSRDQAASEPRSKRSPAKASQVDTRQQNTAQLNTTQLNTSLENAFVGGLNGADQNWVTWYHRRNLILGHAWEQDSRWQAIVILPQSRWMADIVAVLPDTSNIGLDIKSAATNSLGLGRPAEMSLQQLVDVEGNVIHQWSLLPQSQWSALTVNAPDAEIPVTSPLDGWRLRQFATDEYRQLLAGDDLRYPVWLAVSGLSLALILTGVIVTVNVRRELRLAAQRVSFVNQVSHELRTPLTNICMYADLIAQSYDAEPASPEHTQQQERLSVIRAESQRLARLINNVLEFARPSPNGGLQRHPEDLDEIVRETLATFEPKLHELGFQIECDLQAPGPRLLDRGAVEQILVNLIGNAEKYAVAGKFLRVATSVAGEGADGAQVQVLVADRGPGVPARMREQIFVAFSRLADRLEDPAGTGIGLTIARDLARKHGGDCELVGSEVGAVFRLTLHAPIVDSQ